jgi:DNA-directed RNA polymerase sigma subunit (sigma70/sigma32)
MDKLTAREEQVLRLRFGRRPRPVSPQRVAEMLGISLRSERQIERHALRRLRSGASFLVCGSDEV